MKANILKQLVKIMDIVSILETHQIQYQYKNECYIQEGKKEIKKKNIISTRGGKVIIGFRDSYVSCFGVTLLAAEQSSFPANERFNEKKKNCAC